MPDVGNALKIMAIWLLIWLIIHRIGIDCQAQRASSGFVTSNYSEKDGLPNDHIFIIRQDTLGFLWIGTWDGLARFDGRSFINYRHDPNDSTTIPYFYLQSIRVDRYNNIWVMGGGAVSKYHWETDQFVRYRIPDQSLPGKSDALSLATDQDGNLWALTSHSLFRYCKVHDRFEKAIASGMDEMHDFAGSLLAFDNQNDLWICHSSGTLQHGKVVSKHSHEPAVKLGRRLFGAFYRVKSENFALELNFYTSKDARYLIASNIGLYMADTVAGKFSEIGPDVAECFEAFHTDFSWSKEEKGIWFHNAGRLSHHSVSMDGKQSVLCYFIDKENSIWYGAREASGKGTGLHQVRQQKNPWRYYPSKARQGAEIPAIFSILEDHEKNVWLASRHDQRLIKISPDGNTREIDVLPSVFLRKALYPRTLFEDENRTIWTTYFGGYLFKAPIGKPFEFVLKTSDLDIGRSAPNQQIIPRFIAPGVKRGTIQVFLSNGIILLESQSERVLDKIFLQVGDIYSFYRQSDAMGYIGGVGILQQINGDLEVVEKITIANGLYNIEDIVPADSGRLWLALLGGGICLYDVSSGTQQLYTTFDGLGNNVVYSILKDEHGNLWLSTNDGISMFNTQTRTFVNYNEKDGLAIREFNSDAKWKSKDGTLFFGGMGGAVSFHPDSLGQSGDNGSPRLMITGLVCNNGKDSRRIAVYGLKEITLEKGSRFIKISFTELNYLDRQNTGFRYRIVGLADEWTMLGSEARTIEVAGLQPGDYQIEISATDLNGNWSKSVELKLLIPPFYYETLWFKLLVEIVGGILIVLIIIYRLRHLKLIHRHRISNLKQLALQEQMNPHFISNSLVAIETFSVKGDHGKTNEYIARLYSLMRKMIDYGGKEYIPFEEELSLITDYLEAEKIRVGFDYSIVTTAPVPAGLMIAPSFIQPLIENAIKHGVRSRNDYAGRIEVEFGQFDGVKINCTIRDNGKGIPEGKLTSKGPSVHSKGLKIIYKRLEIYHSLMKKNFGFSIANSKLSNNFPGATVSIDIPVKFD